MEDFLDGNDSIPDLDQMLGVEDTFLDQYLQDLAPDDQPMQNFFMDRSQSLLLQGSLLEPMDQPADQMQPVQQPVGQTVTTGANVATYIPQPLPGQVWTTPFAPNGAQIGGNVVGHVQQQPQAGQQYQQYQQQQFAYQQAGQQQYDPSVQQKQLVQQNMFQQPQQQFQQQQFQQQQFQQQQQQQQQQLLVPGGSGSQNTYNNNNTNNNKASTQAAYSDQGSMPADASQMDSNTHQQQEVNDTPLTANANGPTGKAAKPRRRRVRNGMQQVQNKLAQQRYREKRKNKFNEMQESVEVLSHQVQRLQEVEHERTLLKGENDQLSSLVQQQQEQILKLQQELASVAVSDHSKSNTARTPNEQDIIRTHSQAESCVEVKKEAHEQLQVLGELEMLKKVESDLKKKLDILRDLIKYYHIDPLKDANGPAILEKDKKLLNDNIRDVCTLSVHHTRHMTLKVVQEKFRSVDEAKKITCPIAWQRFKATFDKINLTEEQVQLLLEVRSKMLAKLKCVYEQRQKLNMQMVGLIVPHRSATGELVDTTVDSKIDKLSKTGVFPCVASNLEFHEKIEEIRQNIRQELGIHACANFQFVTKVLTPVQAAVGLVEMDPVPLDVLGLGNFSLALKEGRVHELVAACQGNSNHI